MVIEPCLKHEIVLSTAKAVFEEMPGAIRMNSRVGHGCPRQRVAWLTTRLYVWN